MIRGPLGLAVLATSLLVLAAGLVHAEGTRRELETRFDRRASPYVGSDGCARCHASHTASFDRTFHRTMTQDATAPDDDARLAPFDGSVLRYGGYEARFTMEDGARVITIDAPGQPTRRYVVDRTTGSHRYQQFLAREGDIWTRLPVGYHVEEQRFFHMNEAFLTPDPPGLDAEAPIARADYDRHVARWNDNCVFCHTVAPSPGLGPDGTFDTHVAELGVACEACHGPGGEHAARNADPLRRYLLHLTEWIDPTIVTPSHLSAELSADVCGPCHGQRITDDIDEVLAHGDGFMPGEDLALYSAPLFADTTLNGDPVFAARFWSDGTPRLTAYEYQGMLMSACAIEGELTCTTCHGMHEGDPDGQLRPSMTGDAMCTGCHAQIGEPHPLEVPHTSVGCVSCHMPEVVYGVRGVRVSHRIDVPALADAVGPGERPSACVLCHADADADEGTPENGALFALLFGGDPVQRSVAASALGAPDRVRGASEGEVRGWLLEVMRQDPYPAVRAIAFASLCARSDVSIDAFVPTDGMTARAAAVERLRTMVSASRPSVDSVAALAERRSAAAIEIGE